MRRSTKRFIVNGLVSIGSVATLVLGQAAPASAELAGAQTGWEEATEDGPCGVGLPVMGFALSGAEFVLTDVLTSSEMTIQVGAHVAAPQGAAAGDCDDQLPVVVPGLIPITSVEITGPDACTSSGGDYTRVNSTVVFNFSCGGNTYVVTGQLTICDIPIGPFTSVENPICDSNEDASGHLVTAYVGLPV